MGAGNKLDPTAFRVADIYKTKVCPLAKVMRIECRKRRVKKLKVVYSEEQPTRPIEDMSISCRTHCICPPGAQHKCTERRDIPGSTAFVPSVVGLIMAYRDYVTTPVSTGYQSLHIIFYDDLARGYTELQLRTKDMNYF